jgi:hypothetical protein
VVVVVVAAAAVVAAATAVPAGVSTKPNSSSSSRACNRFTRSALRPLLDNPRFSNSALSSETNRRRRCEGEVDAVGNHPPNDRR